MFSVAQKTDPYRFRTQPLQYSPPRQAISPPTLHGAKKRAFSRHFRITRFNLPRRAWDKHRETFRGQKGSQRFRCVSRACLGKKSVFCNNKTMALLGCSICRVQSSATDGNWGRSNCTQNKHTHARIGTRNRTRPGARFRTRLSCCVCFVCVLLLLPLRLCDAGGR